MRCLCVCAATHVTHHSCTLTATKAPPQRACTRPAASHPRLRPGSQIHGHGAPQEPQHLIHSRTSILCQSLQALRPILQCTLDCTCSHALPVLLPRSTGPYPPSPTPSGLTCSRRRLWPPVQALPLCCRDAASCTTCHRLQAITKQHDKTRCPGLCRRITSARCRLSLLGSWFLAPHVVLAHRGHELLHEGRAGLLEPEA